MASRISPYVDNTGLVFAYDLANVQRSYLGEPTVNYVPGSYGYSLYAYASGPVDTGVVNEKGDLITAKRYTITNAVNTARAAIFPSGLTTGVAYTFSFKWKYNGSTTTSPSVSVSAAKGNPEGNNNSFTSQTGDTVNIGNGWYLTTYTFIFSSVPTSACMLTFGINTGSTAGYVGETFDIYEAQFEIKDHRTQYSNGTRSVTQGLKDLTGNSTIDLTNVSFDSNAQMTFDGTDDYITAGNNPYLAPGTGNFTYSCWINPAGYSYYAGLLVVATTGGLWIGKLGSNMVLRAYNVEDYLQYNTLPTVGQWTNVVITRAGTAVTLYYNANSVATATTGYNFVQATAYIGNDGPTSSANFNGKIANTSFYNRALSASEIQQNFNAIKGRYGL